MTQQKNKTNELLTKSLALGLGLFDLTKKQVEKAANNLAKNVSEKDKKKAVDNLFKLIETNKSKLEKGLRSQLNSFAKEVEKATKEPVKAKKTKSGK